MADQHSWMEHARAELAGAGYRTGGARDEVLRMLSRRRCCVTAQELFDAGRRDGRPVSLATVYRTIEVLFDLRLVRRVNIGGTAAYEPAHPGGAGHHHAFCDRCGTVFPFEDPVLEARLEAVADRLGLRLDARDVQLRGRCADCRRPG